MFNVTFKGYFETEDPDGFIEEIMDLLSKTNASFYGKPMVVMLPKDVDYQKQEPNE